MRAVILCGGRGTRLQEETAQIPKPMVEIGGRPILWHIMKIYATFGHKEFVIALGDKGEVISRYFLEYRHVTSDLTIRLDTGRVKTGDGPIEDWLLHLVNTGAHTETGGRIARLAGWLGSETFMLTYGDGVANINVSELVAFHRRHGKLATVTAVRPPARFGSLVLEGDLVTSFTEKSQVLEGWINGGFFVLEPGVLDYIEGDSTAWEKQPLEALASEGQLMAYRHSGFWQCMDTLRDVRLLQGLWATQSAPWKIWRD